jgi:hypothetical protein
VTVTPTSVPLPAARQTASPGASYVFLISDRVFLT